MPDSMDTVRAEVGFLKERVEKIEANLSKAMWLVLSSVIIGILDLVVRSKP